MKPQEIKNRLNMELKSIDGNLGHEIISINPKNLTAVVWMQTTWQETNDPEIGILSTLQLKNKGFAIIDHTIKHSETTNPNH